MKKILSVLLIALLCLSMAVGCAAQKGILGKARWDMTKEELIKAEGEEHIVTGASENVLNWEKNNEFKEFGDHTVRIGYVFSSENKLSSITVQVLANEGETVAEAMKSTRAAMEEAYGKSEGSDTNCHWHLEDGTITLTPLKGANTCFIVNFSRATAEHQH